MTIAIMNKLSYHRVPYDKWLGNKEDIVIFTSSETYEEFCHKGFLEVLSFDSYEKNTEIENSIIHLNKKYQFSKLIALSEYDILRAGKLRSILNIPGQNFFSSTAFRDKLLMKQTASYGGIRVPEFNQIFSKDNIIHFVQNNHFPVILKPISASGSEGVMVLKNEQNLQELLTEFDDFESGNYEVETFIDGTMYHVDGLVAKGHLIFCSVSKYYNGCLEYQSNNPLSSFTLSDTNPLKHAIIKETEKLLEAMPTPEDTSFHAEFFVNNEGEIYLCEVASRTGGGKIGRVVELKYGLNLNQASCQLQCHCAVEASLKETDMLYGFLLIPPQIGTFGGYSKNITVESIVEYETAATSGERYNGAQHSADFVAAVIVKAGSESEIEKEIDRITSLFQENMVWEK